MKNYKSSFYHILLNFTTQNKNKELENQTSEQGTMNTISREKNIWPYNMIQNVT